MTDESNLTRHARDELKRAGVFDEDPEYAESIVAAVSGFAEYGHSGGSAAVGIETVYRLLRFERLTPLTNDPDEWMHIEENIAGDAITWQSRRQGTCFSNDGGRTYYDIDEPLARWRRAARAVSHRLGVRRHWLRMHTTEPASS